MKPLFSSVACEKDQPHVVKSKLNFVPAEKAKPKSEKLEVNDRNSHQISYSFNGGRENKKSEFLMLRKTNSGFWREPNKIRNKDGFLWVALVMSVTFVFLIFDPEL